MQPIENVSLGPGNTLAADNAVRLAIEESQMDVPAEHRRRAAECERLAADAITEEHRQTILQIAESWRAMADQRERMGLAQDKPNASGSSPKPPASGRRNPKQ